MAKYLNPNADNAPAKRAVLNAIYHAVAGLPGAPTADHDRELHWWRTGSGRPYLAWLEREKTREFHEKVRRIERRGTLGRGRAKAGAEIEDEAAPPPDPQYLRSARKAQYKARMTEWRKRVQYAGTKEKNRIKRKWKNGLVDLTEREKTFIAKYLEKQAKRKQG